PSDTGSSNTDNITKNNTPTFDITTNEASVVHLENDGSQSSPNTATASGAGTYAVAYHGVTSGSLFNPYTQYTGISAARGVAADFNGDGVPDLVEVGVNSAIVLLLGNGD